MATCRNILSRIRPDDVAESHVGLPDVYNAIEEIVHSVVEVPQIGKVLFTHRRHKYRHHKSTNWFWGTTTALLLDDLL